MTKDELYRVVAQQSGVPATKVGPVLDALADLVNVEVRSGRDITIPGVGKFSRGQRSERKGRNLRTGEAMTVAARRVVKFKPSKDFKDAVA